MTVAIDRTNYDRARELPNNLEAEQALIGALLIRNDALTAIPSTFSSEHFSEPLHARIYDEIVRIVATGKIAHPVTLKASVDDGRPVGDMTISQYMAKLAANAVNIVGVPGYAAAITFSAMRRAMISVAGHAEEMGYDCGEELNFMEQAEALKAHFDRIVSELHMKDDVSGDAAADAYLSSITGARSEASTGGVPICLPELESVLGDHLFREKRLYGLLSSSGEGKTSLTMQIIYAALMAGHPVLMLSYDQTRTECVAQMAAQALGTEVRRQLENTRENPLLSQQEVDECYEFARKVFNLPFEVIDCDTEDTAERLCNYARRFLKKKANGLTPLIVIDHIRAIKPEDVRVDEGTKALVIGQKLKSLAKSTSSAVLVLQQRSGAGMRRENPRPIAADLYGGEAARQPFDAIFYLYRAELHMGRQVDTARDENEADKIRARFRQTFGGEIEGNAELGCLKLRFGNPTTKRHVRFDERLTKYVSKRPPASQERMI